MRILAIETSCDETAVALLEIEGDLSKPSIKLLGNSLLSQIHLHEKYGGVYPNLAKREHIKNLPILLEKTLEEAGETEDNPNIDFIAVTNGPGLEPALWTGIEFAKELGRKWDKPIVPVNHMVGHIFSVLYESEKPLELPAIALLVSGGHTELIHIKDFDNYEILGETKDDAVGEAFDKVARMLGLPYPGGPKISELAESNRSKFTESKFSFPRPMAHSGDLNFSYSGLKTSVLYKLKELGEIDIDTKADIARAFEDAAIDALVIKTRHALEKFADNIKTLIVAGGVSNNTHLTRDIENLMSNYPRITLRKPVPLLTTDNAIMIGIAGFIKVSNHPEKLGNKSEIQAIGNLPTGS